MPRSVQNTSAVRNGSDNHIKTKKKEKCVSANFAFILLERQAYLSALSLRYNRVLFLNQSCSGMLRDIFKTASGLLGKTFSYCIADACITLMKSLNVQLTVCAAYWSSLSYSRSLKG